MALCKSEGQNGFRSIPRLTILEMFSTSIKITFVPKSPKPDGTKVLWCRIKNSLASIGLSLWAGHGGKSVVSTAGKRTMRETEVQIGNSGLFLIPKVSVMDRAEVNDKCFMERD